MGHFRWRNKNISRCVRAGPFHWSSNSGFCDSEIHRQSITTGRRSQIWYQVHVLLIIHFSYMVEYQTLLWIRVKYVHDTFKCIHRIKFLTHDYFNFRNDVNSSAFIFYNYSTPSCYLSIQYKMLYNEYIKSNLYISPLVQNCTKIITIRQEMDKQICSTTRL